MVNIARIVKSIVSTIVAVGGLNASVRFAHCLQSGVIDLVVRGDGEEPFLEILDRVDRGQPLERDRGHLRATALRRGPIRMPNGPRRSASKTIRSRHVIYCHAYGTTVRRRNAPHFPLPSGGRRSGSELARHHVDTTPVSGNSPYGLMRDYDAYRPRLSPIRKPRSPHAAVAGRQHRRLPHLNGTGPYGAGLLAHARPNGSRLPGQRRCDRWEYIAAPRPLIEKQHIPAWAKADRNLQDRWRAELRRDHIVRAVRPERRQNSGRATPRARAGRRHRRTHAGRSAVSCDRRVANSAVGGRRPKVKRLRSAKAF